MLMQHHVKHSELQQLMVWTAKTLTQQHAQVPKGYQLPMLLLVGTS